MLARCITWQFITVWKVELDEDSGKGSQPQGLRKIKRKLYGHQLREFAPLR
jgi:hypothetical protein